MGTPLAVNFTDAIGLGSSIATLASAVCAIGVLALHRKVKEIHVLVNERLDTALNRIKELEKKLDSR